MTKRNNLKVSHFWEDGEYNETTVFRLVISLGKTKKDKEAARKQMENDVMYFSALFFVSLCVCGHQ